MGRTVYRADRNITGIDNKELSRLTAFLREKVEQTAPEYIDHLAEYPPQKMTGVRDQVQQFMIWFDTAELVLSKTTHYAPTQESKLWSDWEGGHSYTERPNMKKLLGWK